MFTFSKPHISLATHADINAITCLLNSAYRGESSKQGWTTEAHLIGGDIRTNEETLQQVMDSAGSVILKYLDIDQHMVGCVNLQQKKDKIYLGMFSVSPQLQGFGIGKQLLKAAEEYALQLNAPAIFMQVITQRTELIDWYKRYGYQETGERIPFNEDGLTGKHLQPLEFMVLEKTMQPV
jgi:ribosomal protein S18 acetylase RimI-like enzyme